MNPIAASIETILAEAIEIASPADRAAYVDQACDGDAARKREVERLIANHFQAGAFLETPPFGTRADAEEPRERVGCTIGRYKLLEQIGEGGMGVVFMAEQLAPVRRNVALKIVKPGMDSQPVIARFEAERQALALMDHPNIARVLDGGSTGEGGSGFGVQGSEPGRDPSSFIPHPSSFSAGRPYFVMELVRGIPITEYCDQYHVTLRQRLELFVQVCHAVQHAHQKGIIHRDIKPSNVMVTLHDGVPVPKVIDFGVAKAIGYELTERTLFTTFAQLVGTPLYMSPEQAALSGLDVDTRSDVYSLGVLLYEMLTGRTPFESERLREAGYDEMRRIIREEEPPRPSVRVTTLKAACTTDCPHCHGQPRDLVRSLRGELDWIVMKCLEKDRARRYESPSALATDVERYLRDEPVHARPAPAWLRIRKWLRRHPASGGILAVSGLSVIAIVVGALWHNYRLAGALEASDLLRKEVQESEAGLRQQVYATDVRQAWQAWDWGNALAARAVLGQHLPGERDCDPGGFEWRYLWACCQSEPRALKGHEAPVLCAAVSPDGRLIASGDRGGALKIWDFASGRDLRTLRYGTQELTCVAFDPQGRTLATAGQDRTVRLWDMAAWKETACLRGHTKTVCSIAWSPDGKRLASAARDHFVKVWDVDSRREIRSLSGHTDVVRAVAWSPDGTLVASGSADTTVRLWDARTGEALATLAGRDRGLLALAFSPDGQWLASAGYQCALVVHNVARREEQARFADPGCVWSLAFSADQRLLAAGLVPGFLQLFKLDAREREVAPLRRIAVSDGAVRAVVFAERDRKLVTASEEGRTIEIRDAALLAGHREQRVEGDCLAVDVARDLAVTAGPQRAIRLRSFQTGTLRADLTGHTAPAVGTALSPRDGLLAVGDAEGRVLLFDAAAGKATGRLTADPPVLHEVAFSPDGALLAGGDLQGAVQVWEVATGARRQSFRVHSPGRVYLAFSPDGKTLAAACDGTVDLRRVADGRSLGPLEGRRPRSFAIAFSPDGKLLAVAGESRVWLYDVAAAREVATLVGHRGMVGRLAFSPDGRTLATIGHDRTARLWHVATRRELFTLLLADRGLKWVQFASARMLLVGAAPDARGDSAVYVFDGPEDDP